jgi:hypothetical protein
MSKYSIEETTLTSIADKIRTLRGISGAITPEEMATQIQAEADSVKISPETCNVTIYPSGPCTLTITAMREDGSLQTTSHVITGDRPTHTFIKNSIVYVKSDQGIMQSYSLDASITKIIESGAAGVYMFTQDVTLWVQASADPI